MRTRQYNYYYHDASERAPGIRNTWRSGSAQLVSYVHGAVSKYRSRSTSDNQTVTHQGPENIYKPAAALARQTTYTQLRASHAPLLHARTRGEGAVWKATSFLTHANEGRVLYCGTLLHTYMYSVRLANGATINMQYMYCMLIVAPFASRMLH